MAGITTLLMQTRNERLDVTFMVNEKLTDSAKVQAVAQMDLLWPKIE
jgi:hypothetical protein